MIVADLDDVVRGDSYPREFTAETSVGGIFDLVASSIKFTVKERWDISDTDDNAILQLTWVDGGASSGITVDDPTTGVMLIEMTPSQTNLLVSRSYKYDIEVLRGSRKYTLARGRINVQSDVTRV